MITKGVVKSVAVNAADRGMLYQCPAKRVTGFQAWA